MDKIDEAFAYAAKKHTGQKYGKYPFMRHPLQTFRILEVLMPEDESLLTAALLHDVLEETKTTIAELRESFGDDVANLVQEVTKTDYNTFPLLKTQRGVILKFADRLANLSNMEGWSEPKKKKYIKKSIFWK